MLWAGRYYQLFGRTALSRFTAFAPSYWLHFRTIAFNAAQAVRFSSSVEQLSAPPQQEESTMKRPTMLASFNKIAALALCASLPLISACAQRETVPFNVKAAHPERFICEGLADRPAIPPEHTIDWSQVQTIEQAHSEHLAYVRSIRTREGKVAGYLVEVEGRLFQCASNMEWQRDYYDGLAD